MSDLPSDLIAHPPSCHWVVIPTVGTPCVCV